MKIFKNDKLFKISFIVSGLVLLASIGVKSYFCNSMAVKNNFLETSVARKAEIEEDIEQLDVLRSSLSSIEYLEGRAKELGFVEMESNLISLDLDAPAQVALVTSR